MTYVKLDPCSTRLGNWMFQYAAAKCAMPDEPVTFVIGGGQDMGAIRKYDCLWPDAQYAREIPQGAHLRIGLYQDAKYVNRSLSKELFLRSLQRQHDISAYHHLNFMNLVSVHVRRGDYMSFPHRHPFVGEKYLTEAITRFPNAEFMVFSDEILWCKRFFKGGQFHFAEGNDVLTDLYLMTQCRGGHVCSNSTFSWWGAYLGEGKAVFPSLWFGPAIKGEDWQGLYFDGSDVIENGYSFCLGLKALACMFKNSCGNALRSLGLR